MTNTILGFFFGILINIVDDINDYKVGTKYKIFFETLLVILSIYILYLDRNLGPIASLIFSLGGIIGLFFAPHIIDANIWRLIIALSIPPLFYYLSIFWKERDKIKKKDIHNFILILTPLFILSVIFSLLEDYLVPEEFSQTKLIETIIPMSDDGAIYCLFTTDKRTISIISHSKRRIRNGSMGMVRVC